MDEELTKYLEYRTLSALAAHIGEGNAIGMAELYERVFERPWEHRINDTRQLRRLITTMRDEGTPICSVSTSSGGGYYLAAAGSELIDYLHRGEHRALKILGRNARMRRITLPEYLGQMRLNIQGEACDAESPS